MKHPTKKTFVGIKTYYYRQKTAEVILTHAHAHRNGFTKSINVHTSLSKNNSSYYYHGAHSCAEKLKLMCEK